MKYSYCSWNIVLILRICLWSYETRNAKHNLQSRCNDKEQIVALAVLLARISGNKSSSWNHSIETYCVCLFFKVLLVICCLFTCWSILIYANKVFLMRWFNTSAKNSDEMMLKPPAKKQYKIIRFYYVTYIYVYIYIYKICAHLFISIYL